MPALKIFDHFDRIRIINLPQRTDRRREMDMELRRVGLAGDPRLAYFAAVRPEDAGTFTSVGARGAYQSHKEILHGAAEAGESVLILEDDCEFVRDAANQDIAPGWDIFYGGYTALNPDRLESSDIEGAHMMGFSRRGVQMVGAYLAQLRYQGIHPPIDAAYVWFRRANPDVPTHFAKPPLAGQRSSRSDIADLAWYDRYPLARQLAQVTRVVRRRRK
jgi:glycosyl transferase family 25